MSHTYKCGQHENITDGCDLCATAKDFQDIHELRQKLAIAVDALQYIATYMCVPDMVAEEALHKIGEVK